MRMEQESHKLSAFLASARAKANLSLRSVEAKTGISNAYLSQLETAKIKTPAPQNLHKLAELYRVPYALLMELAGYPVTEPGEELDRNNNQLAARIGIVSEDEEEQLVEYLAFLRSRKRGRS